MRLPHELEQRGNVAKRSEPLAPGGRRVRRSSGRLRMWMSHILTGQYIRFGEETPPGQCGKQKLVDSNQAAMRPGYNQPTSDGYTPTGKGDDRAIKARLCERPRIYSDAGVGR